LSDCSHSAGYYFGVAMDKLVKEEHINFTLAELVSAYSILDFCLHCISSSRNGAT